MEFRFHKMMGISWLDENCFTSEEEPYSMEQESRESECVWVSEYTFKVQLLAEVAPFHQICH